MRAEEPPCARVLAHMAEPGRLVTYLLMKHSNRGA